MINILLFTLIVLSLLIFFLLVVLLQRKPADGQSDLKNALAALSGNLDRMERSTREEIAKNRQELGASNQQTREELQKNLNAFSESVASRMTEISTLQKNQLDTFSQQLSQLTKLNEEKLENVRSVVEDRLKSIQDDNNRQLEQMRQTVDEKLHLTLEKRLGESFRIVSEQLDRVHKGLGDMQNLAAGVVDLRKILANVKTRGIFGEQQLENLLSDILSPEQYVKNVVTKKGTRDPVEFAIRLVGNDDSVTLLPVDSKFPIEIFQKLLAARETADPKLVEFAGKEFEAQIKLQAKTISEKYIDPPYTEDAAIMFLSTESLAAEVYQRPGLVENIQRSYHVTITGPVNFSVILGGFRKSYQMIAVKKRVMDVWNLLGSVRREFMKFGEILERVKKQIDTAGKTLEEARTKTRTIESQFKKVQEFPAPQVPQPNSATEQIQEVDVLIE